jgi:UDP-glucose 4-epimerase
MKNAASVMRCLITGGAGFIGSNLARALLKRGWKVEAIDNLATSRMSNIEDLLKDPNFTFHKGSIMNRSFLRRCVKRCDLIFHLAAGVGVKYILEHPLASEVTNLKGTENVLELASKYHKKIIIASTSEVYGKHPLTCKPFKENDDRIMGPTTVSRWGYAEAKAMDEFLALAYAKEKKLRVIIVRFFNVVGPVQIGTYGMVLPRLIGQALRHEPLTVFGDGRQLRSFTYIDDAVDALIGLAMSRKAEGKVFNIGSNDTISIRDLAKKIKKKTHLKKPIRYISYKKAYGRNAPNFEDMMCRIPDISKIKKAIGYKPRYDMDDIIENTIRYFRGQRGDKK